MNDEDTFSIFLKNPTAKLADFNGWKRQLFVEQEEQRKLTNAALAMSIRTEARQGAKIQDFTTKGMFIDRGRTSSDRPSMQSVPRSEHVMVGERIHRELEKFLKDEPGDSAKQLYREGRFARVVAPPSGNVLDRMKNAKQRLARPSEPTPTAVRVQGRPPEPTMGGGSKYDDHLTLVCYTNLQRLQLRRDPTVWITNDQRVVPVVDLTNSHLKNIIGCYGRQLAHWRAHVRENIFAEARSRGLDVPETEKPVFVVGDRVSWKGFDTYTGTVINMDQGLGAFVRRDANCLGARETWVAIDQLSHVATEKPAAAEERCGFCTATLPSGWIAGGPFGGFCSGRCAEYSEYPRLRSLPEGLYKLRVIREWEYERHQTGLVQEVLLERDGQRYLWRALKRSMVMRTFERSRVRRESTDSMRFDGSKDYPFEVVVRLIGEAGKRNNCDCSWMPHDAVIRSEAT